MAWYATGTVAVTNNNAAVTGTGTAFVANVEPGDIFSGPDGRGYEVVSVNSNTSLTIGPVYAGSTASGQAYRIAPTQGRIPTLNQSVNTLIGEYGAIRDGIGAGNFPDGSAAAPAFRFGADTDTGFFRSAANVLGIAAGGVARLLVGAATSITGTTNITGRLNLTNANDTPMHINTTVAWEGLRINSNADRATKGLYVAWTDPLGNCANIGYRSASNNFSIANIIPDGHLLFGTNGLDRILVDETGTFRANTDTTRMLGAASFRWNTVFTGTVNSGAGLNLSLKTAGGQWNISMSSGSLHPNTDNALPLGGPSNRPSLIYAASGTINTSDAREKTWRGAPSPAELTAARRIAAELGFFQWSDAVAEKGPDGARLHFGVRAQAVWDIMADEGLIDPLDDDDPSSRYAFLCWDKWAATPAIEEVRDEEDNIVAEAEEGRPAGDRFGVRTDQLALFLIAAQEARLAALEEAA